MSSPALVDLLWRAFPEGFLAMRGVSTLGGAVCARDGLPTTFFFPQGCREYQIEEFGHCIVHPEPNNAWVKGVLASGYLLPWVSPEDPATWACLLRHLLRRAPRASSCPSEPGVGISWQRCEWFGRPQGKWYLQVGKWESYFAIPPNTHDPALALVHAFILQKEEGA